MTKTIETTDILLCLKYLEDGECIFHKNEKYKRITYLYSSDKEYLEKWSGIAIYDNNNKNIYFHKNSTFDKDIISKHFVSLKESRKLKLEKINGTRNN